MEYAVEILNKKDIMSYKKLIDGCFGLSNPIEKYMQYSQNDNYIIWVIKEDNKVIGSVTEYHIELFTFDFQPCLMLFNIAVDADYRCKGVAHALLEHVIFNAKTSGYRSISLTCLDSACEAHKLYESVGFVKAESYKYAMNLA